ncbi:hypothetical protein ColLi_10917 [Colletotrichum liriopes]|uniref:Uncharacterized protein n=1 Tax=Colletotrichum liriopes TaxID=708192 RepID=A0AA37GVK3_9PEZI|nr:hypothetical protein ColLi_10917 [Colletotrichum liriopes]
MRAPTSAREITTSLLKWSPRPPANNAAITNSKPTSRQLADLAKLIPDDHKYSGEMYDVFDIKSTNFLDNCEKVNIEEGQLGYAFSIMLQGIHVLPSTNFWQGST